MSILRGKKILLGITGGIAAYKSAFLIRLFIKSGCEVRVVMTEDAEDFITPLTISTLSKNPVLIKFSDEQGNWNNHVELAKWADLICIAPATANSIAKMAHGQSDNPLIATYLSAECPTFIAPAMDVDMYKHVATQKNCNTLKEIGNKIIPAESGELASGLFGAGRMAEPEHIVSFIEQELGKRLKLSGKKVLITAGPTYEPLDPVRFIGNRSSGKMGYALAEEAFENGAEVVLISGPTSLQASDGIETIRVGTAKEMYHAALDHFPFVDLVIAAAAVADYRPVTAEEQKIKKKDLTITLELEKTDDILKSLGELKRSQILVGFALETENELENATQKLREKNLDLIVLNSLRDAGAGFGTDTNKVTLIGKEKIRELPLKCKKEVAAEIIEEAIKLMSL